ncbi:GGDEF domain-containing protein [Paracraurococcus ruber]|uniref:diguanylate cyclase n=1 Tax=Paracraurococcus ruber TaxID=77675 RepID=A0ABS1D0V7_9PROT|nr:GGDEF domain-containing protein [Paracraurococcus ruber]MBK1659747.1 hypothetical protein [Paracraurococcus ruber]TDG27528.1 GGDEF domain-containing protein [Paracraurococcus ruber]
MPNSQEDAVKGGDAQRAHTVALAHAAISSMMEHGLPPSPDFFAIWYDYHAGTTNTLRRLIDTYLTNRRAITEEVMHQIHERFFDTQRESAALMEAAERLRQATDQVVSLVAAASGDTSRYGDALNAFRGNLTDTSDLGRALAGLIAQTQEMARRSALLGAQLDASSHLIIGLQAQLQEALTEANTDPLTNLPNRRAIEALAALRQQEMAVAGRPFSVAVVDVDHFKSINDTWGHPVGDAVLRRIAATLAGQLKDPQACGRFGGEEFVVLLPGLESEAAARVADGLRQAVAAQQYSVRATGGVVGPVTLSAGIATRLPGEAWSALVARADSALYRAKQDGRNRVVQHLPTSLAA